MPDSELLFLVFDLFLYRTAVRDKWSWIGYFLNTHRRVLGNRSL